MNSDGVVPAHASTRLLQVTARQANIPRTHHVHVVRRRVVSDVVPEANVSRRGITRW